MPNDFDWSIVEEAISPKKDNKLNFDKVSHLFRKVAFDVYKPLSGSDKLWELREENGEKFLVALYDDSTDMVVESQTNDSDWTAVADSEGKNVTLAFKKVPIYRFASGQYKFSSSLAHDFARFIEKKAQDGAFLHQLLEQMPKAKRDAVIALLKQKD